ncbi:histidine kinase [Clostridium sp.]|uniref:sensor histidine kinase n=1 Tax=Clostridium sp. TaxID=1506 RepID=UPI002FC59637
MKLWSNLKGLWKENKLRKKLIIYFMATIILMGATNAYPLYTMKVLIEQMSKTFEMNEKLNTLHKTLEQFDYVYNDYLSSKYSTSLDQYYKYGNELRRATEAIKLDYLNSQHMIIMKNVKNMVDTYLNATNEAVMARRGRAVDEYLLYSKESAKVYQYIKESIQVLNNSVFLDNTDHYLAIRNGFYLVETLSIALILSIIVISILLILWFAYTITKPITELSQAAGEISKGNYNIYSIKVESDDEIGVMAEAFNKMSKSIIQNVSEIKEKAELEGKLKEQELENAIMKSNLKEAELHALQTQINPHFLFNTLNAGAQIAMLEGADRACAFIEHAANIFRYNIRNLDRPVTLRDEMNNIESYMYLLKERFADKIDFSISAEESILDLKIPCLILQPIVENAIFHGLGDAEYTGLININAVQNGNHAEISVKDNGKGMSKEKIKEILSREEIQEKTQDVVNKAQGNGIGLNNIFSRLNIFYNTNIRIDIYSELGYGTEMILHIPIL